MTETVIYCSGPMFSASDLWQQAAIASELESAGYTTYLPQRDGLEVGNLMKLLLDPQIGTTLGMEAMAIVRRVVFSLDIYQLFYRCNALVFNMDGRVPDGGSIVETSLAFAQGKPIVVFKTTPISMLAGTDNPMISGLSSTWTTINDPDKIAVAIATKLALKKCDYSYRAPDNIAAIIAVGKIVSSPDSDLRKILAAIDKAPDGKDALADAKKLLEWAETSGPFQKAFSQSL